jgi:thymidylate synthase (FAD)
MVKLEWMTPEPLKTIEKIARVCYKSEHRITDTSANKFIANLIKHGHEAMLEHAVLSYRVVCDRGVSHSLVRHRLFSFAQESTCFCKYDGHVQFVIPPWVQNLFPGEVDYSTVTIDHPRFNWLTALRFAEAEYHNLLKQGWTPAQARTVLPHSVKTELLITGNLRQWRSFFKCRIGPKHEQPQVREIANLLLNDAYTKLPIVFEEFIDKAVLK